GKFIHKAGNRNDSKRLADRRGKMRRLSKFLGHSDANKVTRADLDRYKQDNLLASLRTGEFTQATTVDDHVEMVGAMFRWGHKHGYLDDNAADRFKKLGAKTDP